MSSKDWASSVSDTFPTMKRFRFDRTSFSCRPNPNQAKARVGRKGTRARGRVCAKTQKEDRGERKAEGGEVRIWEGGVGPGDVA